ncbi:MAG: alpha-galactosidase [Parasphingopyxis sp.]|uniref:alpha-galactosidase n=1 Tax=Parasphingopyxis sp. TaxID=1920299 RepID=UPI003F9FD502
MAGETEYLRLDGDTITVVVAVVPGEYADLVYLGPKLDAHEQLHALHRSGLYGAHESQPDSPPVGGLLPEPKHGDAGPVAVAVRDGAQRVPTDFRPMRHEADGRKLAIALEDAATGLQAQIEWSIEAGDAVRAQMALANDGDVPIAVDRLAALALPVPRRFDEAITYAGRWAAEMQEHRAAIGPRGFVSRSRRGKPGFDGGNWLMLCDGNDDAVIGAHLCWSGDYDTVLESDADGRAMLVIGPALEGGEIVLTPGERFETQAAVFAYAEDRTALGQLFHRHLREEVLPGRAGWGPRKVHLNSWEALAFDMDEAKLIALADDAADLGVERFVLDDGWFAGRRNDRTSLGDWEVSRDVLPNGLDPLIDYVEARGMDFGLWVEPEMVSPDSDLYRAHPDWCLHEEGRERRTQRHQLVLDLTRAAVSDYLFERIDALLGAHRIAYLKWDHNRDLFPAANADGPAGYAQTLGLYRLLDRLRAAHPAVEIESCASGGGRVDLGILSRCNRIWASDSNDAIERLRIVRSWAQFLPLEVIGNHVGPSPNPITGRRLSMDFRAKVAMFGHMGVEADPGSMTDGERKALRAHIALYKSWRDVLHGGVLVRLDHPDQGVSALLSLAGNRGLALAAQTRVAATYDVAPVRMAGLDPDARYRVTLPEPWPRKAMRYLANHESWREGHVLSGRALVERGIALPLAHPETAWLVALERTDG